VDDRPGKELPKDWRRIAADLVENQGWRYEAGKRHAKLYPPDTTMDIVVVPSTPSSDPRAFKNFISKVRQSGGRV
jgi:hypothetical protein